MTRGTHGAVRGSLVAAAAVLLATPAAADPGRIGLSPDGRTWAASLPAPLFDPDVRWVPGDRRIGTFWVRNQSADPADLAIELLGVEADALLRTGDLTVAARRDGGPWREVTRTGTQQLLSPVSAPPGQARRVDVAVALDADSTNVSMTRSLAVRLRVVLQQAAHGPGDDGPVPTSPRGNEGAGLLPATGGPLGWLTALGVAALAVGLGLRGRRHDGERVA